MSEKIVSVEQPVAHETTDELSSVTSDSFPSGDGFLSQLPEKDTAPLIKFGEHVAAVRKTGDEIDAIGTPYRLTAGYRYPLATGTLIGTMISYSLTSPTYATPGTAFSITAAGASIGYLRYVSYKDQQADERLNKPAQIALGQEYSLLRVKDEQSDKPEIVLHWHGATDTETDGTEVPALPAGSSMTLMADLAAANDIRTIFVERSQFEDFADEAQRLSSGAVDGSDWLKRRKQIRANMSTKDGQKAKQDLLAFTPDQLRVAANRLEQEVIIEPQLAKIIQTLREYAPEHPIIRRYDSYRHQPHIMRQKLQIASRMSLERRMSEVDRVYDRSDPAFPIPQKRAMQGTVRNLQVDWHSEGKPQYGLTLARSIDMTLEDAEKILAYPQKYNTQNVIQAAEYAAYLFSRDDYKPPSEDKDPIIMEPRSLPLTSFARSRSDNKKRLKHRPSGAVSGESTGRRSLHALIATAIFAGSGAGAAYANFYAHEKYQDVKSTYGDAYGAQQGTVRINLTDSERQTSDQAAAQAVPLLSAYEAGYEAVRPIVNYLPPAFNDWFKRDGGDHQQSARVSGLDTDSMSAGNLDPNGAEDQTVEWQLESHGAISTAGYWDTNVGSMVSSDGVWTGQDPTNQALRTNALASMQLDTSRPYITASRILSTDDSGEKIVRIPVLFGTAPVDASVGGSPANVFRFADNTYAVDLSATPRGALVGSNAVLRYDLQKPNPDSLHFVRVPQASFTNDLVGQIYDRDGINRIWNKYRTPIVSNSPLDQAKADESYVREHFNYSYAPLDKSIKTLVRDDSAGWANFADDVLARKQANCNIAATILAIDNPTISVAWGYHNNGDDSLVAAEAHAWNVDGNGQIYDGTPPLASTAAVSNPNEANTIESTLLAIGGVAGLFGLAVAAHETRRIRRRFAAHKVSTFATERLLVDRAIVAQAAFGRNQDVSQISGSTVKIHERSIAVEQLTKHHMHSSYVRGRLEDAIRTSDDAVTASRLRRALRTLRTFHRAGMVETLTTDRSNISGLL